MKAMKAFAVCIATATSAAAIAGTAADVPPSAATAPSEIFRLLKERRDAFYQGDFDRFGTFETDDFTRISEDGELVTKAQQLAYLRALKETRTMSERPTAYADDDLTLDLVGDVALLTGRLTETEPGVTGSPRTQQSRFTEIWVYRAGRWQTLHNHYTTIAP